MTPVPTRVRKVSEKLLHTRFVLGDFGVTVGVRPFEEGVRDYTGGAVTCGSERYGVGACQGERRWMMGRSRTEKGWVWGERLMMMSRRHVDDESRVSEQDQITLSANVSTSTSTSTSTLVRRDLPGPEMKNAFRSYFLINRLKCK